MVLLSPFSRATKVWLEQGEKCIRAPGLLLKAALSAEARGLRSSRLTACHKSQAAAAPAGGGLRVSRGTLPEVLSPGPVSCQEESTRDLSTVFLHALPRKLVGESVFFGQGNGGIRGVSIR